MRLFYCDQVEIPLPDGHRFPSIKYRLLREALLADGLPAKLFEPSEPASWEQLALFHDAAYLTALQTGSLDAAAVRRLGFPWSEGLVGRSRRSVGGTVAAAQWALRHGAAANLAGGTHHAFPEHGEGYCVFNDIGVAIKMIHQQQPELRVAVVDLDVHQGNGTAKAFADEPRVFTLSMHGRRNFPFHKQRSSLDVELEDRCDDLTYLSELDRALEQVESFEPQLVFYIAGADVLAEDSLGLLSLSQMGVLERDERVVDMCDRLGCPRVMVMGGGYSKPIDHTVTCHRASYAAFVRRHL